MSRFQEITLTVPFIYEAIVIKPRCRKPSLITIRDQVTVTLLTTTLEHLPIAFTVGERVIRWSGQYLWDFALESSAKTPARQVLLEEVIANTQDEGANYPWSSAGAAAPFKNFWHEFKYGPIPLARKHGLTGCGFDAWLNSDNVVTKEDAVYRDWIEDNRYEAINRLYEIANSFIVVDGTMYQKASEPRYEVNNFGAGHNFSVAMFISYGYNPNVSNRCYFNAHEFEQAKAFFEKQNPDKNKVAHPNCGNLIEVLIPEAVRCIPKKDHVE